MDPRGGVSAGSRTSAVRNGNRKRKKPGGPKPRPDKPDQSPTACVATVSRAQLLLLRGATRTFEDAIDGIDLLLQASAVRVVLLHRHQARAQHNGEHEWFITMAGAKTGRDLALSLLVANAVESLWDVARRCYTGRGGSIRQISRSVVETVIYQLLMNSRNVLSAVTMEMTKLIEGARGYRGA